MIEVERKRAARGEGRGERRKWKKDGDWKTKVIPSIKRKKWNVAAWKKHNSKTPGAKKKKIVLVLLMKALTLINGNKSKTD